MTIAAINPYSGYSELFRLIKRSVSINYNFFNSLIGKNPVVGFFQILENINNAALSTRISLDCIDLEKKCDKIISSRGEETNIIDRFRNSIDADENPGFFGGMTLESSISYYEDLRKYYIRYLKSICCNINNTNDPLK